MASSLKLSQFINLKEYINSVVSEALSNTWTVEDQDIQKQILKSKNSLITLKSNLASPEVEEKFSFESVKCFLCLLIDDCTSTRWTIMKEILKVLYNCLIQKTELEKWNIFRKLESSKYKFYLYKLLDFLEVYGDYDFQILILKVITVICEEYDPSLAQEFIPESSDLQHALMKITKSNFIIPARDFLNIVNERNKNIFSIGCRNIILGSIKYKDNGDGLRIHFNKIDKIVSWYTKKGDGEEINSELEEYNNFRHLIFVFNQNVDSIKVVRSLCKTIQIIFKLKESCWSYYSEYQHVIENELVLKIVLDYSAAAEYLIHTILPGMKCNLRFEKKRKLVDESVDVKRFFRQTNNCNKHRRVSVSSISTNNTSNTEIILIKPISDLIKLEPFDTTDIDDMEVHFSSQDQLAKMAQGVEAYKSLMNSLSGVDSSTNNIENNKNEALYTETTLVGFNTSDKNASIRDSHLLRVPRRFGQGKDSKRLNESIHKLTDTSQRNTESGKENNNEPFFQTKTDSLSTSIKKLPQDNNSIQIYNDNTSSQEPKIHTSSVANSVLKDIQPNIQAAKTAEISMSKKGVYTEENRITLEKKIEPKKKENKHFLESTSSESSIFVKTKESQMKNSKKNKKFDSNNVIESTSSESLVFSCQSELYEPKRDSNKKRKKSNENVGKSFKSKESRMKNLPRNKKIDKTKHSLSFEAQVLLKIKNMKTKITHLNYELDLSSKGLRQAFCENKTFPKLQHTSKLCETKDKSRQRKSYKDTSKLCETKSKSKRRKSYDIDLMREESKHIYGEDEASNENLVLPGSTSCHTPPPQFLSEERSLHSTAPKWTTSALLNGIEVTLSSNEFIGKSLFIIFYNFDISCASSEYISDISEHNMRNEEFEKLGTNLLFCTKGPNTDISEWVKTFENPEIVQNLKVPLVVDYGRKFMHRNFHMAPNCNCLKSSILVDIKGNVVYKTESSIFGDVVDVELSLKLVRQRRALL